MLYLTHLVAAALAPGQLGDGDGDEDHEEAGGQVLVVRLALWRLPEGGEEAGVDPAAVAGGAGELCHQRGLVGRAGVAVEVPDGGGEEGDPLLQLRGQRVLDQLAEAEDHT